MSILIGLLFGAYAARQPKLYSSSAVVSTWMTEPSMLSARVLDSILPSLPPSALPLDRRRAMLADDISLVRARNQVLKPGDPITMAVTVYRNKPDEAKLIVGELIKAWTELMKPSGTRKQKYDEQIKELSDDLATIEANIKRFETDPISTGAGEALAALYPLQSKTYFDLNNIKEMADGFSEDEIIISPATTPDFGRDKYPMAGPLAGLLAALLLTAITAATIALRLGSAPAKGTAASTAKSNVT